jgi:arylsulfatase A-like enzyme
MSIRPALLALAAFLAMSAHAASSRPNIVFILIDDMGWQDTSVEFHTARTPFNDYYRTPNMERLARTGVRLTQAYSCAVCTPTRVSWLSGRNAARHHVTNWTNDGETGYPSEQLLPPAWKREGFQPGDAPTAPGLLRAAGYRTILVGKAHFGAARTPGADPLQLGFDVNIGGHSAGRPASYQGEDRYDSPNPGEHRCAVPGLEQYKGTPTHLTDALTSEACREITHAVKDLRQPFFLYFAHYAVHSPIQPHRPYDAHYRSLTVGRPEMDYASMIEGMDASVGRVLDTLRDLGVARDTLIVFYSDNGGVTHAMRGRNVLGTGIGTHNKPLREGKGSAYEGGIRVPAIVTWAEPAPDHPAQQLVPIASGARSAQPVLIEDLFPTFLRWGGATLPSGAAVDGEDLTPALAASTPPGRKAPLIWHFPNLWNPKAPADSRGYRPHSVIRDGDWKAIYFYEDQRWELYHLATDTGEANDLSTKEPARLHELARRLDERLTRLKAPLPIERTSGKPRAIQLPPAGPNTGRS